MMPHYKARDVGRVLFTHNTINRRVSMIAVNIEVKIPNDRVTANPLTGPEPNAYKNNAANRVVRFASIMVEMARA